LNYLNEHGAQRVSGAPPSASSYLDVSGENIVAALDMLQIVNYLNARSADGVRAEGEADLDDEILAVLDCEYRLRLPTYRAAEPRGFARRRLRNWKMRNTAFLRGRFRGKRRWFFLQPDGGLFLWRRSYQRSRLLVSLESALYSAPGRLASACRSLQ